MSTFFKRKTRQKNKTIKYLKIKSNVCLEQGQTYKSMREHRHKPIHLLSTDFQQECQNHPMGKQQSFQQMILQQRNNHMQKNEA